MSTRSAYLSLLVLVVSQVSYEQLIIERFEKINTNKTKEHNDDLKILIEAAKDGDEKKKLEAELYDGIDFKHIGVNITYGEPRTNNNAKTKETFIDLPTFFCLNSNNEVHIIPYFPSKKKIDVYIHVRYDFGNYEQSTSYINKNELKDPYRVCFFYGHYSPSYESRDDRVYYYFDFLTERESYYGRKIYFLVIERKTETSDTKKVDIENAYISLFESNQVISEDNHSEKLFKDKTRINASKCTIQRLENLKFLLNNKQFYTSSQGSFDMAFFHDNARKPITDTAKVKFLDSKPVSRDGSKSCFENFVDIMVSQQSIEEFLMIPPKDLKFII